MRLSMPSSWVTAHVVITSLGALPLLVIIPIVIVVTFQAAHTVVAIGIAATLPTIIIARIIVIVITFPFVVRSARRNILIMRIFNNVRLVALTITIAGQPRIVANVASHSTVSVRFKIGGKGRF